MRTHYHVLAGMGGGYMPDTSERYETKRDALAGAAWHVDTILEEDAQVDDVEQRRVKRGNLRRDGGVVFTRPGNPFDLGHYVEIVPCVNADCERTEEE